VTTQEKYVAAAYLVVFLFVLVYVLIMAAKLSRLGKQVAELTALARERKRAGTDAKPSAPRQVKVG
jgi:CcmD family protein